MKPILYESNEKNFTTNGLGRLDATSCVVSEERNGSYELSMEIPIKSKHFDEIENTRLILAKPNAVSDPQPFEVYDISKNIDGTASVSARHISYRLSDIPCAPFTASSCPQALSGLSRNAMISHDFTFWTDKSTVANYTQELPSSIRERLGGVQGSILDCYGGEYEFDRFMVRLWNRRGQNRGVTIRYGKNLTDAKQEQSIANTATGIVGYWKGQVDNNDVVIYTDVVYSSNDSKFPFHKVKVVDFSNEYNEQPTKTQLTGKARSYITANNIGVPDVSIDVSFVDLADTEEYRNLASEMIGLCDVVTVQYEELGISNTAEVTKIEYDVLNERYNKITLGTYYTLESTINGIQSNVDRVRDDMSSELQKAKENATRQITGANGGYVKTSLDADGHPYEILIMNTDDVKTATKIWRWNLNGLGYSRSGYNGTYGLAMTQDGAIVADFITTGEMSANRVRTGLIEDIRSKGQGTHYNYWNLSTGEFCLMDSSKNSEKGIWFKSGKLIINANCMTIGRIQDAKGINYWDLDTGEFALSSAATVGGSTVSTIAQNAVDNQTQQDIFNKLTNNSAYQGIYLSNGSLYINGSYIQSGTVAASYIKLGGQMDVYESLSDTYASGTFGYLGGSTSYGSTYGLGFNTDGSEVIATVNGGVRMSADYRSTEVSITKGSSTVVAKGNLNATGNISCSGTKSRLIDTEDYGKRLLYCYETPSPVFGDIGEGVIGEDGAAYIQIDPVFSEAISTKQYQVFLQPYGDGKCYVSDRKGTYFVVKGTPGMSFGWEIKGKQMDYDQLRLDRCEEELTSDSIDFGEDAVKHMNNLNKGRQAA